MSPTFVRKKGGVCYRYYVSQALLQNKSGERSAIVRVPATIIENIVAQALERHLSHAARANAGWHHQTAALPFRELLEKVIIGKDGVCIYLRDSTKLIVPGVLVRKGKGLSFQRYGETTKWCPRKAAIPLIRALCRAHRWRHLIETNTVGSYLALARREGMNPGYMRRLMQLAFLAPDIVQGIVDGKLRTREGLVALIAADIPLSWEKQRELFVPAA